MTNFVVEPYELAKEFSRIINEWLTPEELAEANRLNKTPDYTAHDLCATHNYRDSNQAMIDALAAFGVEWHTDNIDLCNAAWDLAKEADFNPEHVRIQQDGLRQYETVVRYSDGRLAPSSYSDWFADDADAFHGLASLLNSQGYAVSAVEIGFPCVVTLALKPLRVIVACEASGVVRRAFRALGHEAWSCDLRPAEDNSPYHLQCDVLTVLGDGWDLMVCHPDCTYLTNSAAWALGDGPYHQNVKPGTLVGAARREDKERALEFVQKLLDAPIEKIALENPIGCIGTRIRKPSQIVQPWMFNDDASKATCLFLKNLPLLTPTIRCPGRLVEWPIGSGKIVERWSNQTDGGHNKLPPSDDRWLLRSRTYEGLASAMAHQWSVDVPKGMLF